MRNITLISTVHAEKGVCKVSKLHQILERVLPEVIFLEIPPSFFDQYFKEKTRSNLESDAVNRYLEMHGVDLVPVDGFDVTEDFWAGDRELYRKIESFSAEYGTLIDRNSESIELEGFAYLNSKDCIDFWLKLDEAMISAIEKIGQQQLSIAYERLKKVMEDRDQEMMKNIQNYCESHEFNSGIFLVGAAHRRSIIEKSKSLTFKNNVAVDWCFELIGAQSSR